MGGGAEDLEYTEEEAPWGKCGGDGDGGRELNIYLVQSLVFSRERVDDQSSIGLQEEMRGCLLALDGVYRLVGHH